MLTFLEETDPGVVPMKPMRRARRHAKRAARASITAVDVAAIVVGSAVLAGYFVAVVTG